MKNDKYIPASILHGKVGEDAYFRAHYAGELCEDKSGTRKDMIIFSAHNFKKKLNFLQTTFKSAQTTKFYKISTWPLNFKAAFWIDFPFKHLAISHF